jgi:hypothetical protein
LPYLQDFKEYNAREEASRLSNTPSPNKRGSYERENISQSRLDSHYKESRAEAEFSKISLQDGLSVGAPRSQSEKSESGSHDGEEEEDLFGFKIDIDKASEKEEDSFARNKSQSSRKQSSAHQSSAGENSSIVEGNAPDDGKDKIERPKNTNGLKVKKENTIEEISRNNPSAVLLPGVGELGSPAIIKEFEAEEQSLEPNDPPIIRKPLRR